MACSMLDEGTYPSRRAFDGIAIQINQLALFFSTGMINCLLDDHVAMIHHMHEVRTLSLHDMHVLHYSTFTITIMVIAN
jgi:fucose permease